jgi:hypothetical protein
MRRPDIFKNRLSFKESRKSGLVRMLQPRVFDQPCKGATGGDLAACGRPPLDMHYRPFSLGDGIGKGANAHIQNFKRLVE